MFKNRVDNIAGHIAGSHPPPASSPAVQDLSYSPGPVGGFLEFEDSRPGDGEWRKCTPPDKQVDIRGVCVLSKRQIEQHRGELFTWLFTGIQRPGPAPPTH